MAKILDLFNQCTVIHKSKMTADDVYIGRPSKYGNPFHINNETGATRERVIEQYRAWFMHPAQVALRNDALRELNGKRLACFCHPLPCHGDVIADYVNEAHNG